MENFIKTGEFAKLANTTKRTLFHYDYLGIISPKIVTKKGERWYSRNQIYQVKLIQLINSSGIPLLNIKTTLKSKDYSFKRLFAQYRQIIKTHLDEVTNVYSSLESKFTNSNITLNKFESSVVELDKMYLAEVQGGVEEAFFFLDTLESYFTAWDESKAVLVIEFPIGAQAPRSLTRFRSGIVNQSAQKPKEQYTYMFKDSAINKRRAIKNNFIISKTTETDFIIALFNQILASDINGKVLRLVIHGRKHNLKKYLIEAQILL